MMMMTIWKTKWWKIDQLLAMTKKKIYKIYLFATTDACRNTNNHASSSSWLMAAASMLCRPLVIWNANGIFELFVYGSIDAPLNFIFCLIIVYKILLKNCNNEIELMWLKLRNEKSKKKIIF